MRNNNRPIRILLATHYRREGIYTDRDGGLLREAFLRIGRDAKYLLIQGKDQVPNEAPVCTVPEECLRSTTWWRVEGSPDVYLYSWAMPMYTPIARAIRHAGCRLIVQMDTDGVVSPRVHPGLAFLKAYTHCSEERHFGYLLGALAATVKIPLYGSIRSIYDRPMIEHLRNADVVAVESPVAKARLTRFLRGMEEEPLARKIEVVPHPVKETMVFRDDARKDRIVLAVGRWGAVEKGGPLLSRIAAEFLRAFPEYRFRIVGRGSELLAATVKSDRFEPVGWVPHEGMPDIYRPARVLVVPSLLESFCIAAAEAVCCGCSVVGPSRIASMSFFTGSDSGTVAWKRTKTCLLDALSTEVQAWEQGDRDPTAMSARFTKVLHAERVATRLLKLFDRVGAKV